MRFREDRRYNPVNMILFILLVIALLFAGDLFILKYFYRNNFTTEFWQDFFVGMLPEIIGIFVVLLFVDSINKSKRNKLLKQINRVASKRIALQVNVFIAVILHELGLLTKKKMNSKILEDNGSTYVWVLEELKKLGNTDSIQKSLKKKVRGKRWKTQIEKFKKLVWERSKEIEKALIDIKPYPSPNVLDPFKEEVIEMVAGFEVLKEIGDFKNGDTLKKMNQKEIAALKSVPDKTVDAIKALALLGPGNKFLRFLEHLYILSYKAQDNNLHADPE